MLVIWRFLEEYHINTDFNPVPFGFYCKSPSKKNRFGKLRLAEKSAVWVVTLRDQLFQSKEGQQ